MNLNQLLQRLKELCRSPDTFAHAVMPDGEMASVRYTKNAEQIFLALHEALHLTQLDASSIAYSNWQSTLKVQLDNPSMLQSANLTTLQHCYLFLQRAERFNEGIWLQALTTGLLSAIVQRLIGLERPRVVVRLAQLFYAVLPIAFIIALGLDLLFYRWTWLAQVDQLVFAGLTVVPLVWLIYWTWHMRTRLPTAPGTLIIGALGPVLSYSVTIFVQRQWSIHLFTTSGMIYIIALCVSFGIWGRKTTASYHWWPFIPSAIMTLWCLYFFYHFYVDSTFTINLIGFTIRQLFGLIMLAVALVQATQEYRRLFFTAH